MHEQKKKTMMSWVGLLSFSECMNKKKDDDELGWFIVVYMTSTTQQKMTTSNLHGFVIIYTT
jgi:hypothetical protein